MDAPFKIVCAATRNPFGWAEFSPCETGRKRTVWRLNTTGERHEQQH